MNTWSAGLRGKSIDAAVFVALVALVYAGLAVAVSAGRVSAALPGVDLLLVGYVLWQALCGLDAIPGLVRAVRRWRRDRAAHRLIGVFADYGLVYRRPVSPPSHAAGRAA